jgi:hypothetical protein
VTRKNRDVDFDPHNRAFTGGCGKPTKPRKNDGRKAPWSPISQALGKSVMPRSPGIYARLEPYANHKPPVKPILRCPHDDYTPAERKLWREMQRMGVKLKP